MAFQGCIVFQEGLFSPKQDASLAITIQVFCRFVFAFLFILLKHQGLAVAGSGVADSGHDGLMGDGIVFPFHFSSYTIVVVRFVEKFPLPKLSLY